MATSSSRLFLPLPLVAVGCLGLTGCGSDPKISRPTDPPRGRYVIVHVPSRGLGSPQTIELDTATGKTWALVSTGPSDVEDVTAWLPIDDLTSDSWRVINAPAQPRKVEAGQ